MIGTTFACALKLFQNTVALEKDDEQVCFINIRIKVLWECLDQDEEVGEKHMADTERFQVVSREPIAPLAGEPRELIELEDGLLEEPTLVRLSRVDADAQNFEDGSQKEDEDNDELIAM